MKKRTLIQSLRAGEAVGCFWLTLGSPIIAELMLEGEPDVMVFDRQHGLWTRDTLEAGIGLAAHRTECLVRVAENSSSAIGEALDAGASGVIVPLIETPEEAARAVAAAHYPPKGNRSGGGIRPLKDFAKYVRDCGERTMVTVMIETKKGLANAKAIAAVDGVDMVFIGTGDLALSLGVYPGLGKKHEVAIAKILDATREAKKIPGIFSFHSYPGLDRLAQGFRFVVQGIDSEMIGKGAKAAKHTFERRAPERDPVRKAVVFISGANRGIGKEFVKVLVANGAKKIYCGARDVKSLRSVIALAPTIIKPIEFDLVRPELVHAAAADCADVTLLINNAGSNHNQPFSAKKSMEYARDEMEVNYFGLLATCCAFAPILKKNDGGTIVNLLSVVSHVNAPMMGSLCASKAAALSLTQALRAELAKQGTRVVGVLPGAVDTRMTKDFDGPKIHPSYVAQSVLFGLRTGLDDIYPGDMAANVAGGLALDSKTVERGFAAYLPRNGL